MFVRKLDYKGVVKATYEGEVIARDAHSVTLRALWERPAARLPFVTFERGDVLHESFFDNRWYNIFEIHNANGKLKGWYADVTRPARIAENNLDWEDLLLDIWMGPDGAMQVLDEDEFAIAAPELVPAEALIARQTLDVLAEALRQRYRAHLNDEIATQLTRRGWTVGTAESCTGGLIGDELTNRPGSSDYFKGGIISYENRIKQQVLGVREQTLTSVGAVSEQCALEMARGVRKALGIDVGISATGIAGPCGETPGKPVGLVYIGISTPDSEAVRRYVWPHDRMGNKRATADAALALLVEQLQP